MTRNNLTYNIKNGLMSFKKPLIMGILNTTPDSFYDGGQFNKLDEAIKKVENMLIKGVDIIDVGGMSSRPGAEIISIDTELKRVIPIILLIKKHFKKSIISIDTVHGEVANEAIKAGAAIINDISAGNIDKTIIEVVAKHKVPYILMHMQGKPKQMQNKPDYENIVNDVLQFFKKKIEQLKLKGINDIIIDPGFGFGKTINHNYQLLKQLKSFELLGFPILAGISRKSMIYKPLNISANEALNGTTALNMLALLNGANLLRVHDIKAAKEAVKLYEIYNTCY